jgi:hypothetical protein
MDLLEAQNIISFGKCLGYFNTVLSLFISIMFLLMTAYTWAYGAGCFPYHVAMIIMCIVFLLIRLSSTANISPKNHPSDTQVQAVTTGCCSL